MTPKDRQFNTVPVEQKTGYITIVDPDTGDYITSDTSVNISDMR